MSKFQVEVYARGIGLPAHEGRETSETCSSLKKKKKTKKITNMFIHNRDKKLNEFDDADN